MREMAKNSTDTNLLSRGTKFQGKATISLQEATQEANEELILLASPFYSRIIEGKAVKEDVQSKRSPIKYEEADFDSFHQDKSNNFSYPCYYGLPHLHPCFEPAQPYTKDGLVSSDKSDEVDIDSMTIAEYELYVRIAVKNLKKQEEAKVEECDEGDIYDICDITVEDVERLRLILTLNIHSLPEPGLLVQPCVPLLPSPNELKVERDEESNNDVSIHVPDVLDDEAGFNPAKDIEELERLLAKDLQSYVTEIQRIEVDARKNGAWHGHLDAKENFQAGLVGCYTGDDDESLESWMLFVEANLEHVLEHVVSLSYRVNPGEFYVSFLTLPFLDFYA
ncbi:hypothetical protein Tco_0532445 [Tanacetum coccineum]